MSTVKSSPRGPKSLVLVGAAAALVAASAAPAAATVSPAAPPVTTSVTTLAGSAAPTLDWGDIKFEYYTDGVVIGYAKGESMGMRILSNLTCFRGEWVGTGHWLGSYYAAGGKYGEDGDVTWVKGKKLIVKLPRIPIDKVYARTTAKKAAKLWGSTARAKASLKKCWTP